MDIASLEAYLYYRYDRPADEAPARARPHRMTHTAFLVRRLRKLARRAIPTLRT